MSFASRFLVTKRCSLREFYDFGLTAKCVSHAISTIANFSQMQIGLPHCMPDRQQFGFSTNALVTVRTDGKFARFSLDTISAPPDGPQAQAEITKHTKMPGKEKMNKLRSCRLKANSAMPECHQAQVETKKKIKMTRKAKLNELQSCHLKDNSATLNGHRSQVETTKKIKMSRKAKLNELRFYRLKAKKKMKSPNPEVRIRYKLEKAKRKEEWLITKLRKFDVPKSPDLVHDPEILTEEERFYLRRTGEKKKNYINVGKRGVFGGVVLNMHLHWKRHETVKVVCKPCRPGQVHGFADELARLSKGIIIDIKADNTIIFYRGKNYARPEVLTPFPTLTKQKALEKYKYEQSLEHTGQYIEKLEQELEEYRKHLALYKKRKEENAGEANASP